MANQKPTGGFNALVPELDVFDLEVSRKFWCDLLGFSIAYERPENNFIYLENQGSQVMLNKRNGNWETGALERPLGRGINFQMFVNDIGPILNNLQQSGHSLFKETHENWYRVGDKEVGSRQFLVQDPDGYLLRFVQDLGER